MGWTWHVDDSCGKVRQSRYTFPQLNSSACLGEDNMERTSTFVQNDVISLENHTASLVVVTDDLRVVYPSK